MPKRYRQVTLILMKRKHINLTGEDKYGHWWFVIGHRGDPRLESYGWWPRETVGPKGAIGGVEGELNGQTSFGGLPTEDPHHRDDGDEEFHPWVPETDSRTDEQIADCLRQFAQTYTGEWRWTLGKGQNCHSFQEQAMNRCGLRKHPPKGCFL
jgi:hypothetical protein